ncbi:MAG: hypothetical protein H0X37_23495 [Herpetosiphonaceae bacterium]|nr:hypothetical protein [Herpetosiphonaceae bacterium]
MLLLSSCAGQKPLAIGRNSIPTATPGLPGGQPSTLAGGGGLPVGDPAANTTAVGGQPMPNASLPITGAGPIDSTSSSQAAVPTSAPSAPLVTPTINPDLGKVAIPVAPDYQQRWLDQQVERVALNPHQTYASPGYQIVYWFDPIFGSYIPIGESRGPFEVQVTFRVKGEAVTSLGIPFNKADPTHNYGLAVPDAIVQRMKSVNKDGWVEVFIRKTSDITPK